MKGTGIQGHFCPRHWTVGHFTISCLILPTTIVSGSSAMIADDINFIFPAAPPTLFIKINLDIQGYLYDRLLCSLT